MIATFIEVWPTKEGRAEYLAIAAQLKASLIERSGFISIERFQSLTDERKILSLSFWKDEESIRSWRNELEHRMAQNKGKKELFEKYRIRVAQVVRDYSESDPGQAPVDSNVALDCV